MRVDPQLRVVRQRFFRPDERVARIVAQAVKQLGKVQVEVGQESVHADDVGQRDAQVAAVFLHPVFEGRLLEIAQPHTQGLVGLQVFMRHGADGRQLKITRQQHIGCALEVLRHLALERADDLALPVARVAAAHAKVEELERVLL